MLKGGMTSRPHIASLPKGPILGLSSDDKMRRPCTHIKAISPKKSPTGVAEDGIAINLTLLRGPGS